MNIHIPSRHQPSLRIPENLPTPVNHWRTRFPMRSCVILVSSDPFHADSPASEKFCPAQLGFPTTTPNEARLINSAVPIFHCTCRCLDTDDRNLGGRKRHRRMEALGNLESNTLSYSHGSHRVHNEKTMLLRNKGSELRRLDRYFLEVIRPDLAGLFGDLIFVGDVRYSNLLPDFEPLQCPPALIYSYRGIFDSELTQQSQQRIILAKSLSTSACTSPYIMAALEALYQYNTLPLHHQLGLQYPMSTPMLRRYVYTLTSFSLEDIRKTKHLSKICLRHIRTIVIVKPWRKGLQESVEVQSEGEWIYEHVRTREVAAPADAATKKSVPHQLGNALKWLTLTLTPPFPLPWTYYFFTFSNEDECLQQFRNLRPAPLRDSVKPALDTASYHVTGIMTRPKKANRQSLLCSCSSLCDTMLKTLSKNRRSNIKQPASTEARRLVSARMWGNILHQISTISYYHLTWSEKANRMQISVLRYPVAPYIILTTVYRPP
ncbi:uncharacterized protein BDR25DRAFT_349655 [Lindgomyces ingoldianus]|uniref:Uncharacterized protein n=1 Tax=Lindgomyces ingoldianus TaxID=673940 RepID=A0ACB6RB72_9PLEO|nr:uncharacterized protein BDR25DRAFT_349655 [Lindgomyces ingoldianus]KAF2476583.1 hypothetical protein BDR25DRAFT_349655 [Lindgomyces ingoldianus]